MEKLEVAVTLIPPFVIKFDGQYRGFEIDLWTAIAKEIGLSFEYTEHSFQELIPLLAKKGADVGLAAITINEKREEIIDFSQPTFNSGLRILISKDRSKISIGTTIKSFLSQGYKQLVKPLLVLFTIVIVFGNILWWVEQGNGSLSSTYLPGVFQAVWLSFTSIIGADGGLFVYEVNSWIGRIILSLAQITNLAVLGLLIGELTAFITTRKVRLNIENPSDLKGKIVSTVAGSTSVAVLHNLGTTVVPVVRIEEAYKKLKNNDVDAVVFDSPVLIYYALNEGSDWAMVTGDLFNKEDYGIALQAGSQLRELIDRAILTLRESGSYDTLYSKWFGEKQQSS